MSTLKQAIQEVERIERESLEAMTAIADGRIHADNRRDEIARRRKLAQEAISTTYQRALLAWGDERKGLESIAAHLPTPTPDEANQLAYMRSTLLDDAETSRRDAMVGRWQAAIEAKDSIVARVFLENMAKLLRFDGLTGTSRDRELIENRYPDLVRASRELAASEEQRAAIKALKEGDAAKAELKAVAQAARERLSAAKYTGSGLDVPDVPETRQQAQADDGAREAARAATRRMLQRSL